MSTTARPGDRVIRASELARHGYCARAWWLGSVRGVASSNTAELRRGTAAHARHGRTVAAADALRYAAAALAALALALILASMVLR